MKGIELIPFSISKSERKYLDELRHSIHISQKVDTLKTLIYSMYKNFGSRTAIVERVKGDPVSHTCADMFNRITSVGTALCDMGFSGKHVGILGENSYDWLVAFFAVVLSGGIAVPLDKELDDETISMLLTKADCDAVFCTKPFFKTIKKHMAKNTNFTAFSIRSKCDDDRFTFIEELVKVGDDLIRKGSGEFTAKIIRPEDVAAIFFTSGTTGSNKGVQLTHKNLCANVSELLATIPTEYSSFSVLPMNHVYELSCNCFTALYMNAVIYINDSLKNIKKNLLEFKPEAMAVVPMIIEGLYNGIWANAKASGKDEALKKLVELSNRLLKKGIDLRPVLFSTIRKNFCVRKFPTVCCGGAPSRAEYMTGMGEFGFRIYNGYGMTEASPSHTLNLHAELTPESAGIPMPGCELRIEDPDKDGIGEIWIKGDNVFSAYYNDPEATAASFKDGWFMTGDYGRMENGELYVSGRKKNLIILDNGENIFPEDLEFFIMDNIPYVTEVVVIEAVKTILGKHEKIISAVTYIDPEQFGSDVDISEKYASDISALNKRLPSYKKIQDTVLTSEPMEKNSTRKIIRQKIIDKYSVRV